MDYSKYLNKCYIDISWNNEIFIYRIIVHNNIYGIECYETRLNKSFVYNDFDFDDENSLSMYIPELCKDCESKEISELEFNKIKDKIKEFYEEERYLKEKKLRLFQQLSD